jgi:hypothetical protein
MYMDPPSLQTRDGGSLPPHTTSHYPTRPALATNARRWVFSTSHHLSRPTLATNARRWVVTSSYHLTGPTLATNARRWVISRPLPVTPRRVGGLAGFGRFFVGLPIIDGGAQYNLICTYAEFFFFFFKFCMVRILASAATEYCTVIETNI